MCEKCTPCDCSCDSNQEESTPVRVRGFEILPGWETVATLPVRATRTSAGYDFVAPESGCIPVGRMIMVKTGITAYMPDNEFLSLHIRSGLSYKHELTLQNDEGIVDADYYGKNIGLLIRNEGDSPFFYQAGDRLAQGIFETYKLADGDSFNKGEERASGFGSTGK
jgi:dUTP pyrophosphatase